MEKKLKMIGFMILGNAILAMGTAAFVVPNGLISGGVTGIGLILQRLFGLPVDIGVFVADGVLFLLGAAVMGKAFAATIILSTIVYPTFFSLFGKIPFLTSLTDDKLMAAIYAGLLMGAGIGLVIKVGGSTGGMDIPPLVLNKYFHIPVSASMLVFDMLILCLQAAFSPLQQCLYGIVMVIVYTVVLDKVLIFGTTRTEVKIISQHADDIREAIFTQLDRGVTVLHGEGGYSHEPEQVLLSIVSNRQLPKLEKLAHAIDPTCFMIVSHVTEVSGRGFSLEKNYQAEG